MVWLPSSDACLKVKESTRSLAGLGAPQGGQSARRELRKVASLADFTSFSRDDMSSVWYNGCFCCALG